ncbi:FAD-dependent oxidoreductase [Nocardia vinacea]|uniref:FAD-dependent oxidoreductase n=1 Tax=Nocardia vinacea TaxID=96468 RepID=A0ABZ1YT96_9NOCA|nr:FAD-dependent oxidoreductase [Nocardia vinacea]
MSIVIVGSSVTGIRTAQALRRHGVETAITVLDEDPFPPYDKPPLSKGVLAAAGDGEPVPLLTPGELAALDLDLRLGVRVIGLDPVRQTLRCDDGGETAYTRLVIATGVTPRTLPGADSLIGVHTLRRFTDASALRAQLPAAERIVVVGAGFIGSEFASAALEYGAQVAIVEAQETPMAHLLGAEVGAELARLHRINGVELHAGVRFAGFEGSGRVSGVALADGRVLPADLVVVGIGARPATDWLAGSGLPIDDGIACDENLRVTGFPGIYAAGDVASRQHPIYRTALRIEHWTNAGEHAEAVAADIAAVPAPPAQLPYVWSDQYGKRIQIIGRPALGHPSAVHGTVDTHRFVAVYADDSGVAVGALAVDDPRALMKCRKAITNGHLVDDLGLDDIGSLPASRSR